MKAVNLAVGLLQVLLMTFNPAVIVRDAAFISDGGQQVTLRAPKAGSSRTINHTNNPIHIDETGKIEPSSAVGQGVRDFVFVYVKENRYEKKAIYASTITFEGIKHPQFPIPISDHDSDCGQPAIAYHASSELFVIVYAHNHQDIYVRIFSPSSEFVGPGVMISDDQSNKGHPVIACNQAEGSCLVAYQFDDADIKGRYIEVDSDGIAGMSEVYDLTDTATVGKPHLAWGRGSGTYLVAYNERIMTGEVRPRFTHVSDQDDPLAAEKYLHPSQPVVPDDFYPTGKDAFVTDVAFDPCTRKYVLTLDYDPTGGGQNFDVWAAVIHATDPISSGAFAIAETSVKEYGAAIRFFTADHAIPACGSMDRLMVAYINADIGLMAVELRGNSNPTAPNYHFDPADQHQVIAHHKNMFDVSSVTLSSGLQDMRVLVAYEMYGTASAEYAIWGRFIAVRNHIYLPLVLR